MLKNCDLEQAMSHLNCATYMLRSINFVLTSKNKIRVHRGQWNMKFSLRTFCNSLSRENSWLADCSVRESSVRSLFQGRTFSKRYLHPKHAAFDSMPLYQFRAMITNSSQKQRAPPGGHAMRKHAWFQLAIQRLFFLPDSLFSAFCTFHVSDRV